MSFIYLEMVSGQSPGNGHVLHNHMRQQYTPNITRFQNLLFEGDDVYETDKEGFPLSGQASTGSDDCFFSPRGATSGAAAGDASPAGGDGSEPEGSCCDDESDSEAFFTCRCRATPRNKADAGLLQAWHQGGANLAALRDAACAAPHKSIS